MIASWKHALLSMLFSSAALGQTVTGTFVGGVGSFGGRIGAVGSGIGSIRPGTLPAVGLFSSPPSDPSFNPAPSLTTNQILNPAPALSPGDIFNPRPSIFRPRSRDAAALDGTIPNPTGSDSGTHCAEQDCTLSHGAPPRAATSPCMSTNQSKEMRRTLRIAVEDLESNLYRFSTVGRWVRHLQLGTLRTIVTEWKDCRDNCTPEVDALSGILAQFESVDHTPGYETIAELPGFHETRDYLIGYISFAAVPSEKVAAASADRSVTQPQTE